MLNADGSICNATGSGFGLMDLLLVVTIIRFADPEVLVAINVGSGHTYFGDADITAVASSESITIDLKIWFKSELDLRTS